MKENSKKNQRREVIKEIKKNYVAKSKVLIEKDPLAKRKIYYAMLCAAAAFVVLEVVAIATLEIWVFIASLVSFLMLLVLAWMGNEYDKKNKQQIEKKIKEIQDIKEWTLEEVAEKYEVTKEELTLYLVCNYEKPRWIIFLSNIIPIIMTGYAVYSLPGYEAETKEYVLFVVLVIANCICSACGNVLTKAICEIDNANSYLIAPYKKMYDKIDKKLEEESESDTKKK